MDTDLGAQLRPHELVAIALDANGQELGRSEQWVNLPRSRAEARLALEVFEEGQARLARVIWQSIEGKGPSQISVTFDGASLQAVGGDRFQIPAHDPEQLHVLSAELVFGGNLRSQVDVAVGGLMGEQVMAEMTAVPLMRPRGADATTVDAVRNRLLKCVAGWQIFGSDEDSGQERRADYRGIRGR